MGLPASSDATALPSSARCSSGWRGAWTTVPSEAAPYGPRARWASSSWAARWRARRRKIGRSSSSAATGSSWCSPATSTTRRSWKRRCPRQGVRVADTDAALALRAVEAWGDAAADRIVGPFALAAWDRQRRRLWCARDFVGMRPLFYHASDSLFLFASDMHALFLEPSVPREPDEGIVAEYLRGRPDQPRGDPLQGNQARPAGPLARRREGQGRRRPLLVPADAAPEVRLGRRSRRATARRPHPWPRRPASEGTRASPRTSAAASTPLRSW